MELSILHCNITMSIIEDKAMYDRLISKSSNVNLTQTWEYGYAKAMSENLQVIRALILKDAEPIAVVQMLMDGNAITINRGPVVLSDDWKTNNTTAINAISFLYNYLVNNKKMHLKIAPNILRSLNAIEALKLIGLTPTDKPQRHSIRVDLSCCADKLRANLRQNWRKQLSKSERTGLTHEIVDDNNSYMYFMRQYMESQIERGFIGVSDLFVNYLRDACKNTSKLHLIYALKDGNRISAMLFAGFFDSFHPLISWNNTEEGRICYAHNYLHWNGILHSKSLGYKWFDMGGIDPEKHPTITYFKRGIGGTEYTLIEEFGATPRS